MHESLLPAGVDRAVINEEFTTVFFNYDIVSAMSEQDRQRLGLAMLRPGMSVAVHRQ